jgi:hypothetical protein
VTSALTPPALYNVSTFQVAVLISLVLSTA